MVKPAVAQKNWMGLDYCATNFPSQGFLDQLKPQDSRPAFATFPFLASMY
jgi:hypothetical protein